MPDLVALAQQLRKTRAAQRRFLAMWALECLLDQPQAADRLHRDLQAAPAEPNASVHDGLPVCTDDRLNE